MLCPICGEQMQKKIVTEATGVVSGYFWECPTCGQLEGSGENEEL
jgi:uncharacterized Zn finger protein